MLEWFEGFATENSPGYRREDFRTVPWRVLSRPLRAGQDWWKFLCWTPEDGRYYIQELTLIPGELGPQGLAEEFKTVVKTELSDEERRRKIRQVRDRLNKATRMVDILKAEEALTNV